MMQAERSILAIAVTSALLAVDHAKAQGESKADGERKKAIVDELLPEELMLKQHALLKKLRPPQDLWKIRKLFDSEPSESSIGLGRLKECWKIAPGYKICFSFGSGQPLALEAAWIERTLPKHFGWRGEPAKGAEAFPKSIVALERFSLVNPIWTPSGFKYVYEITDDMESKSVLVPFSKPNGNKNGEQDGARQPATAPDSKSEGKEKPEPETEGRSQ
jgi:hypothetical protein